ncbi:hypothetical protein SALBM135S_04405 [Streptomyces alboniger]
MTDQVESGRAVEWGRLTVRVQGRRCRCGRWAAWRPAAGAPALLERWREAGGCPPASADEEGSLTSMLDAAYPEGPGEPDGAALAVLEETAEYLGAGLSDLIKTCSTSPSTSSSAAAAGLQLGPRFLTAVKRHITTYALTYPASRTDVGSARWAPTR